MTDEITMLMNRLKKEKGLEHTLEKNREIKTMITPKNEVESDIEKRRRLRKEQREKELEDAEKGKDKNNEKNTVSLRSDATTAEDAIEQRKRERQERREREKREAEEKEKLRLQEIAERKKKREEESKLKEQQDLLERQKRREEKQKQLMEERTKIEQQTSIEQKNEILKTRLKQGQLVELKENDKNIEIKEQKIIIEEAPEKIKLQIIELKTLNNTLQKQVDDLIRENEKFKMGSNSVQIELENKILENNKEIQLLKTDLELYRGKLKEKPLFHTRPSKNIEWPDELKLPVIKPGAKALAIISSNEAYIGEIKNDDGNKWFFGDVSVLKHKVYPSPEVMQETIDSLVMLVDNLKIRQKEMEKEHQRYVEGVTEEMKNLRNDYEKMRDIYGADIIKMHSNINNKASMAYGLECNMAVRVAEAIKDAKEYTKGKSRWYSTTSKNDEKLWADLKKENEGSIDFPKGRHDFKSRLFQFYNSEDNELLCNELKTFNQKDLLNGKAFILDTFSEVFVYYSTNCPPSDKAKITSTALAYNKFSDDGRSINTPVIEVEDGLEPIRFRLQFKSWEPKKVNKEIQEIVYTNKYFSYTELMNPDKLPKWVDQSCLEEYLKDDDFRSVFKMERSQFNLLPRWKKDAERRKAKLF